LTYHRVQFSDLLYFLSCISTLTRYIVWQFCPSVRHVPEFYGNSLTYCHTSFTTRCLNHSSFTNIKTFTKFRRGHPFRGR